MTDSEADPEEQANWLARQWQRVRGQAKRDVIIAQVGDDAENIAVGKNIWQINVAGRNLTIPVFIATACLLAIVGYFLYRQYEYLWDPSQMTGTFKIAVAEFGGVNADGEIGYSEHGAALSEAVYNSIRRQYAEHPTLNADEVQIWHDSTDRSEKNIAIGAIEGDSALDREQQAAKVAEKIRADLLIYGQLDSTGSPDSLVLEFFYRSPKVRNEFDLTQGQHSAGAPILVSPSFADDPSLAQVQIRDSLDARAKALSLFAIGLTYDVLGDTNKSLTQFQLAEEQFAQLKDPQGQEAFYYFVGRAALFEEDDVAAERAFTQAITLDPTYVRAYIGLGSVYLKRAQRIDQKERLANLEDLNKAVEYYQKAEALAANSENIVHKALARLALGSAYRVRGEASNAAEKPQTGVDEKLAALEFFARAAEALVAAEPDLAQHRQYRLLAQTYLSLGAAHFQAAYIYRTHEKDPEKNIDSLNLAAAAFLNCIGQKSKALEDKFIATSVVENDEHESCQSLYDQTLDSLASAKES